MALKLVLQVLIFADFGESHFESHFVLCGAVRGRRNGGSEKLS